MVSRLPIWPMHRRKAGWTAGASRLRRITLERRQFVRVLHPAQALGDLHLPRGRTVDLKLTSTDYIYTLKLPELELEEIAVPELVHTLRVDADRVGSYQLLSDPMCAIRFSHDEEMGRMQIEEARVFQDWLATLVK